MLQYKIYKDGFNVGLARGKNKAIGFIKSHLVFDGNAHRAKWYTQAGVIICEVKDGPLWSIEQA